MRKQRVSIIFILFAAFWTLPAIVVLAQIVTIFREGGLVSIFPILFACAIPVVLWTIVIRMFIKIKNIKKVMQEGSIYTASFVSYSTNTKENNIPKYSLRYEWKDEQGNEYQGKTDDIYNLDEVYLVQNAQTFKIKAIGELSVVIEKTESLIMRSTIKEVNKPQLINCEYCHSVYSSEERQCPNCGAAKK